MDRPGDPNSSLEEQASLAALAGCNDWSECICPEPCWCIHDKFVHAGPDQEESDIGEEVFDA